MVDLTKIKIESLKDYDGVLSEEEFMKLATDVYMITDFICEDYPAHREWYFNKTLPATRTSDTRNILFIRNPENKDEIIAMACLKREPEEKKICTILIVEEFRRQGINSLLTRKAMEWLGTTKPMITMADYKRDMFDKMITDYDWELTEVIRGKYNDKYEELCFNGTLTDNNPPRKYLGLKLANTLSKIIEQKDFKK